MPAIEENTLTEFGHFRLQTESDLRDSGLGALRKYASKTRTFKTRLPCKNDGDRVVAAAVIVDAYFESSICLSTNGRKGFVQVGSTVFDCKK